MRFDDDDIAKIAYEVLSVMLGLELAALPGGAPLGPAVMGVVTSQGTWQGVVTLACSPVLARLAAAAMFRLDPSELSDDEVDDTMGELANIVGGNVKDLVGGQSKLSLPAVMRGAAPSGAATNQIDFLCAAEPMRVIILDRTPVGAACGSSQRS
jgi:chemotaxis protein CheX